MSVRRAYARTSNKFYPRLYGAADERFLESFIPEPNSGCWIWIGDTNGNYGSISIRVDGTTVRILAHRYSYEYHVGDIPSGLQIDHRCQNKMCVNPDHLRLMTSYENTMAIPAGMRGNNQIKTHCRNGHALSGDNLAFDHRGNAKCRACGAEHVRNNRIKYPRRKLSRIDKIAILAARCVCACGCGGSLSDGEIEYDHIIALSAGGTDTNDNMQPLLKGCHKQKTFGLGGDKRVTTAGSDIHKAAKARRMTKEHREFVARVLAKPCGAKRQPTGNWKGGRKLKSRNDLRRKP